MKKSKPKSSLMLETLEDRRLMTTVHEVYDLSSLGIYFPTHDGMTNIYLNFDGGNINDAQSGGAKGIAPYSPPAGQDRMTAIQDILYRTAEIFSPFNVHVSMMSGAGQFSKTSGDTTIFVGENSGNYDTAGHKIAASFTPLPSRDFPGDFKGYDHAPNSDPYDLAFVDPISLNLQTQMRVTDSDQLISQNVAHEAGHTFGLGNYGYTNDNDVMSYVAGGGTAFQDKSLSISDLNGSYNVHDPNMLPRIRVQKNNSEETYIDDIGHQNSFLYLKHFLGLRAIFPQNHPAMIVDPTTIAPSGNFAGPPPLMLPGSSASDGIGTLPNYKSYTFLNLPSTSTQPAQQAQVAPALTRFSLTLETGSSQLDPEIMLFNADGTQLLAAVHSTSLTYATAPNTIYQFVIGGYLGNSSGAYTVSIKSVPYAVNAPPPSNAGTAPSINPALFSNTAITSSMLKTQTALLA